ncbi:MAG TPA: hypothetical protein VLC95_07730 [Anaerolineae bacterium]|nr:hypothetical protein [Anaerolineae bacterium]
MTGKSGAGGFQPSHSSDIPPGMITVMLTLERPSHKEIRRYSRREKYRALKSSAAGIRDELMRWIDEHGLTGDVAQVGEPTAFNTLFVTSTRDAAERLVEAPGVVGVAPTGEFPVELRFLPELPPPEDEQESDE